MTKPLAKLSDDDGVAIQSGQEQMLAILDRAFHRIRDFAESNKWSDAARVADALTAYCRQVKGFSEAAGSLVQVIDEGRYG